METKKEIQTPVLTEEQKRLIEKVKSNEMLEAHEEMALFDLPAQIRKEILPNFIEQNGLYYDASSVKIFDLPADERKKIFSVICEDPSFYFCDEADVKLFDLPADERSEFLPLYLKHNFICEEAELRIFDLPKEEKIKILQVYTIEPLSAIAKKVDELPEDEKRAIFG